MSTRTFESPDRNENGEVGVPGKIFKGIKISHSGKEAQVHENVSDLCPLELKFTHVTVD